MGIVTWASVKCEVYPERCKLYFIPATKLEDLIDFTYQLLKFRFGDQLFVVNSTCLANILGSETAEIEIFETVIASLDSYRRHIRRSHPGCRETRCTGGGYPRYCPAARVANVPDLQGFSGDEMLDILLRPSPELYWKLRYKGGSQEIFFLTTLDKTPDFISTMFSVASEHNIPISDIGVYIQPVHQGVGCHCEFILPFDRASFAEVQKSQEVFRRASHRLFRQGAYFSRPYGIWADMVYNADARTMVMTQKIKNIFDPNHVMNPGKLCF